MSRLSATLYRWFWTGAPAPARVVAAPTLLSHCELELHRDTVETSGGYMLRIRCLDCGRIEPMGWVWTGMSNHAPHHPWEHDDG